MEILLYDPAIEDFEADTSVFACYNEPVILENVIENRGFAEITQSIIDTDGFEAKTGDICSITTFLEGKLHKIILVGLGKIDRLNLVGIRKAVNEVIKEAKRIKSKKLICTQSVILHISRKVKL